jgi:DNA (cytosine-5)-methyltransferase 1
MCKKKKQIKKLLSKQTNLKLLRGIADKLIEQKNLPVWYNAYTYRAKKIIDSLLKNEESDDYSWSDDLMEFWDIHRFFHGVAELERKDAIFTYLIVGHTIRVKMETYVVIDFIKESFKYLGYEFKGDVLNAASYGVPQTRERYILIGIKRELLTGQIELPKPIISNPRDYITVKEAIKDLEIIEPTVKGMDETQKRTNCPVINSYFRKLVMVEKYRDVHNHVCTATRETALQRFEKIAPGQNFHSLPDELKSSYENPGRTQNTVYKRLDPDLPSDTVVNIRKSMWIHPVFNRAVSAREAARLQSFPDDYIFYGTKDSVYQQIGNAVPPVLGRAVAEKVLKLFGISEENYESLKSIFGMYKK